MIRNRYLTLLCVLFSTSGAISVNAQSLGDIVLRPVVVASKSHDDNFFKGLSLYSKQQYAASLMAFDKAVLNRSLSKQELELVEFMQAMSRAKMMKANSRIIIESYINSSTNPTLKNAAMLNLSTQLMDLNDMEAAREILNSIKVKNLDKESRVIYYYANGYLNLVAGDRKQAYADFERCMEKGSSKSDIAQYYMAYIDYVNGNLDKAVSTFEQLATNPNYPETNLYILQIRFIQKDFSFVISKGESVLKMELDPILTAEVVRLIGESFFNTGNYAQAVTYIERYKSMKGTMTRELYYQMGYSYYMQNMYKKSIAEFIKIIDGDDALAQNAYYHLADAYLKVGDNNGAIQAFSMASSLQFDQKMSEDALYNYARLTYESTANNLYSKKIDILKKYINTYPKNTRSNELREYLLTLYLNSSNFDAAMGELSKIKNPNNDIKSAVQRLCYQKATEYFNDKNYNKAIELFDKSLSYPISSKYVALASFWKAESMFKQDIYNDKVINLYRDYLRVAQPTMLEYKMAHYNIGYVYFNNEQWANAVTSFEKFINVYKTEDNYLEDAYLRLGDAMFARKMYAPAQLYYKKSSAVGTLNGDYANYQTAMSEGLMGRNDLKIKTLKVMSNNASSTMADKATIELANTYIKTGDYNEGIAVLEKMTNRKIISPLMPNALLELGVAYTNKGDDDKALSKYKQLIGSYPQSSESKDALVAVKAIYVAKGDVETYFTYVESLGASGNVDAGEKENLTYDAIQRQYIAGNHEKVIDLAKNYAKEFGNGVHAVDVAYYLSESLNIVNIDDATQQMDALLDMPSSQYTLAIHHNAVKLYAKKSMKEKQHTTLLKIYQISTNPSEKKDALEALMELAVKIGDEKIMSDSWSVVFADKDASSKAVDYARYAKGKAAYNKGDFKMAIDDLKLVTIPVSIAEGVQAKFLLADAMFKIGDIAGSEKKVIELSKIETPHQYWVARGFILYGDIYIKKGDLFQAKATFQSILEGYEKKEDGILDTVKKRIESLSTTDTQKKVN